MELIRLTLSHPTLGLIWIFDYNSICFCGLIVFLNNFNLFLVFLDCFNVLILRMNFKK